MEALTPAHLALILLGFLVLFGYKRLPDAARSLGRSLRIFRSEMHAMTNPHEKGASVAVPEPEDPQREAAAS